MKSKDIIATSNIMLAEVSFPSTGQGIELGWVDASNVPIICFYLAGSNVSGALRFISSKLIEYESKEDMIAKLRLEIENLCKD